MRRQDDLRRDTRAHFDEVFKRESQHIRAVIKLRARYDAQLRKSESARIDAIRTVDVGNVTRAAEVASAAAAALATQLANSAEALRAQVEQTRITTQQTLAAALEPIQKDVSELRQVQFQQQGERTVQSESKADYRWVFSAVFAAVGLLVSIVVAIILIVKG